MKRRATKTTSSSRSHSNKLSNKDLKSSPKVRAAIPDPEAPAKLQQMKLYEEALQHFQEQKYQRAHQTLQRVLEGPSKELSDRAKVHVRICEQRISRLPSSAPKPSEDHYTQGVALMNLGRWDEAREHLDRARKALPKADHIFIGEAETTFPQFVRDFEEGVSRRQGVAARSVALSHAFAGSRGARWLAAQAVSLPRRLLAAGQPLWARMFRL